MHPLLEALKPFADLGEAFENQGEARISVEDFRKAQATFKKYNVIPLKVTVEEFEKILTETEGTTGVDILSSGEMMVFKKEEKKNDT